MNNKEKVECFAKILKPYLVGEIFEEVNNSFYRGNMNFNMFLNDIQKYEQTFKDFHFNLFNLNKNIGKNNLSFINLVNDLFDKIKNIKEFEIIKKLIVKPSFGENYQDGVFEILLNSIDDNKILFFQFLFKNRTREYISLLQIEDEPSLNLDYEKKRLLTCLDYFLLLRKKNCRDYSCK